MSENDGSPIVSWADVPASFGLLTRMPIRVDTEAAMARGAASAWAYPLVGIGIALLTAAIATVLIWLGAPAPVTAAVCLFVPIITTGAMHEDGLADSADGLWGGWTAHRRLEIMKDSRIGTYGVLALIMSLLIRFTALYSLIETGPLWVALVACAAISRANMVLLMTQLPNARDRGLSQSVGRPPFPTLLIGYGIAFGITALVVLWTLPIVMVIAGLSAGLCASIAKAKVGGQTGDILGATQQVSEIALLVTFSVLFA